MGDLLDGRANARANAFRDQGITFDVSGEERPFPLDLVPRLIAAQEWEWTWTSSSRLADHHLAEIPGNRHRED